MSDNLALFTEIHMPNEKRALRITIRLDAKLLEMAERLIDQHKAGDTSEYIRGLILADAVFSGLPVEGTDIPGWLIGTRLLVHPSVNDSRASLPVPQYHSGARSPEVNKEELLDRREQIGREIHGPSVKKKPNRSKAS